MSVREWLVGIASRAIPMSYRDEVVLTFGISTRVCCR